MIRRRNGLIRILVGAVLIGVAGLLFYVKHITLLFNPSPVLSAVIAAIFVGVGLTMVVLGTDRLRGRQRKC